MNDLNDDDFGTPNDESPEITEEQLVWAVRAKDFTNFEASHAFLMEREDFLKEAAAEGIPREAFLGLEPNKRGFIQRATKALEAAAKAGRMHAAE
jgi:hypothetical protein